MWCILQVLSPVYPSSGEGRVNVDPALAIQCRLNTRRIGVVDANADERASSTDTFGIDVGVFIVDTSLLQSAEKAARGATGQGASCGACRGCDQPARGDNGADAGYGQQSEARKKTGPTTKHAAGYGAFACAICSLALSDAGVVVGERPFFRWSPLARDDRDVITWNPHGFQFPDGGLCLIATVE